MSFGSWTETCRRILWRLVSPEEKLIFPALGLSYLVFFNPQQPPLG